MNRLKELIDSLDLSTEKFAKIFSISISSVNRYTGANKTEKREIPTDLGIRIAEKYNVSLDWLMGNPNAKRYRDNTTDALLEVYNRLSDEGKNELFNFAVFIEGRGKGNG